MLADSTWTESAITCRRCNPVAHFLNHIPYQGSNMQRNTRFTALASVLVSALAAQLVACSGSPVADLAPTAARQPGLEMPLAAGNEIESASWPATLPQDYRQPWEDLDAAGNVIPSSNQLRTGSAINLDSEFVAGVDRFSEVGDVDNLGQASTINSGTIGSQQTSHAVYRLEMAGNQPGVVAVDINLKARNDGSLSDYWLGVSDYANGQWRWHGPFTDGQARLRLPAGDYLSDLGNTFAAIVAHNGSAIDVIAVAANPVDGGDSTPPPAPDAPVITPVTGGVLLVWLAVGASDLAGYQIYYHSSPFIDGSSTGVKRVKYLDAGRRFLLKQPGQVYVRISAVDISGNESALSEQVSATALPGEPLEVVLETDQVSGLLGDVVNLTASGADAYDFDLNGDGVYEVIGDLTGSAVVDTQSTGIIRPKVRASDTGGSAKALGSVSLIITSQIPPVAIIEASPNSGILWRQPEVVAVTLDASMSYDQDGPSLEYSFDPLGDGTFSAYAASDSYNYDYTHGGTYLATVRVRDSDNLVAYNSTLVTVKQVSGFDTRDIDPFNGKGEWSSMAIVDGNPAITMRDSVSDYLMYVRATDPGGNLWGEPIVIDNTSGAGLYSSLATIAGHPAVAYWCASTNEMRYRRATDSLGVTWTNPPVVLDGPLNVFGVSMREVNGNPAVTYFDGGAVLLKYRRATSGAGTGDLAADWIDAPFVIDNSGDVGGYPALAVISGNPAVAYWDAFNMEVHYKRAVTATGALSGDWPVLAARASPGGVTTDGYISLLEVNGNPAVCFHENAIGSLQYVRATNTTGSITADWPIVSVQVASGGNPGIHNSMALIDGRPCISYVATIPWLGLFFSRGVDIDGTAFEPRVTVISEPGMPAGFHSSLLDIDGLPAISYWNIGANTIAYATPNLN